MKIDYCFMGSTQDPFYLDFWEPVSKVWSQVFNITPILGLICDEDSDLINDKFGLIKKIKKSNFFDDGLQSQIVRLYLSKFVTGNCIISDIDMIPLSKKYFIDSIAEYDKDEIIVLSSHHPQTINTNQYPMCYVIGNNKKFDELFNTNLSWDDFVRSSLNNGWYSDQIFLYNCIQKFGITKVKFPYRNFNNDRIDRSNWVYHDDLVKTEKYIDSHLLRPYNKFKTEIDKLINLL